jgi:hypothetical protein
MKCQFCGLYIYPSLPNATSVQQEMDLNYGPFKSTICNNLKEISSAFYAADLPIPQNTSMFGLIVYGGTILVGMSTITCQNALAEMFDKASNKNSWREVSVVPHTKKCLTNSKMRHDGTDERDPNFEAYQDVQSQNDYSTTQLNVMGYNRGDILRAQFCLDKNSERKASGPVTVVNTCECQEALAAVHTHGKKFFVMGGKHVTLKDMFIAVELNRRREEAAEREKDKKSRVEYLTRHEAELPIVDRLKNELKNDVGRLKSKELEVLLRGKGVSVLMMGNVANRCILYQQFTEGGAEEAGIPALWMEINKAELITLRDAPIAMCLTAYGRFEEQKK